MGPSDGWWLLKISEMKSCFLFEINAAQIFPILIDYIYRSVNGILLPKLFWPTVRKNCSSDRLKFEAEGGEFAKILRSLKQFVQTVKGQNNFW